VECGKELRYGRLKVERSCGRKVEEGGKKLWHGRWKVERSYGMEGGRWKGAVVWKVGGGKEL
jgi:hypothetical protein